MGRHWQTLRGKTKLEVYLKLRPILDEEIGFWSAISPRNKKDAKKAMEYDEEKKEWVLRVCFEK
jgi:hypothetical protein